MVYKFFPPDRVKYFDDELIRFTQPSDLNDPFECLPTLKDIDIPAFVDGVFSRTKPGMALRYTPKQLKKLEKKLPKIRKKFTAKYTRHPEYLPDLFEEKYLKHANKRLGILSLSERWDSGLMWAHYTMSHTGFCIGFDNEADFFKRQPTDPGDIGSLTAVNYGSNRIVVDLNAIDIPVSTFYQKSDDWGYEKELRLIRELKSASTIIKRPTFDIFLFKVPHSVVTEIVLGARADKSLYKAASKFCKSLKIPLYESLISRKTFDMERKITL